LDHFSNTNQFMEGVKTLYSDFSWRSVFTFKSDQEIRSLCFIINFINNGDDFNSYPESEQVTFFNFIDNYPGISEDLRTELKDKLVTVFSRSDLDFEQKLDYLRVFGLLSSSPVSTVKRLFDRIFMIALTNDNPFETLGLLEAEFSSNLLPEFSTRYRIFQHLNSPERILNLSTIPSFSLLNDQNVVSVIYRDLIRVSIFSCDLEIQEFVDMLGNEDEFFDFSNGWRLKAGVSVDDPRLLEFLESIQRLHRQMFGLEFREEFSTDLYAYYLRLRESLQVESDQSVSEVFVQMFLRDLNIDNLDNLRSFFDEHNRSVDASNRMNNPLLQSESLELKSGYLIKRLDFEFFSEVMQRGFVSREHVGVNSESDRTPFDIDLWYVDAPLLPSENGSLESENLELDSEKVTMYGDIAFIIVPDSDFLETSANREVDSDVFSQIEYFRNGLLANNHYGIRTGLSTDKISGLQIADSLLQNRSKFLRMKLDLVLNQKYLPIFNSNGDLIFTTQEYDEIQRIMTNGRSLMFLNNVLDVSDMSLEDLSLRNLYLMYKEEFNTQVVSEGYDLLSHTFMVLKQLDKLASNVTLPEGVSLAELRLFLTLHDIGKPRSISLGSSQHIESLAYIQEISERFNLNQNTSRLFESLIRQDLIGELVQSIPDDVSLHLDNLELIKRHVFDGEELNLSLSDFELNLLEFLTNLKNLSIRAQMDPNSFLQVFNIYYKCDASSYTSDSEGYASLDSLFSNISEDGPLEYNSNIQTLIDYLFRVL